MANFVWKGKTRTGQVQGGSLAADSRSAAEATLRRQNIQITSLKEKGRIDILPKLPQGVSEKRVALFTRQFSVMLDAGLPLVQCMEILAESEENRTFREIIRSVQAEVEQGSSLADAMRKHPKAFDGLYTNMIAAGETGGILDIILQRLSTYIEKSVKLKAQVKSALIYPIAVIMIAVFVVWIILWKVIPVFAALFAGLGGEMPLPTRIVVGASNFLARYTLYLIPALIAASIAFQRGYTNHRPFRLLVDKVTLKIPILGMLMLKISIARFCRTLSTLTSSGVPILEGLEITAKTSGNLVIEDAVMAVRKAVEEGKTIAEPLGQTNVFPGMVVQMIGVGEQTGALDQMLSKIADFYEDEVDTAVAGLMKLIEPLLITVLGGIIGFIVAAMYLPMYAILQKIG